MAAPAQIRGAHAATTIKWVRDAYGEEVFQRIFSRLTSEDQLYLNKQVMSTGWIPFSRYERFLAIAREEVKRATGEKEEEFDLRVIRESGGRMMNLLYKFLLFWTKPTTTLTRLITVNSKIYSQSCLELLQNDPGYCVLRHTGPKEIHNHVQRYTIPAVVFILELVGAEDIKSTLLRDEEYEYEYLYEASITYHYE